MQRASRTGWIKPARGKVQCAKPSVSTSPVSSVEICWVMDRAKAKLRKIPILPLRGFPDVTTAPVSLC